MENNRKSTGREATEGTMENVTTSEAEELIHLRAQVVSLKQSLADARDDAHRYFRQTERLGDTIHEIRSAMRRILGGAR
jgi:hypothetical protein